MCPKWSWSASPPAALLLCLAAIVACGGTEQNPSEPVPMPETRVTLASDPGDPVGLGRDYVYTLADAAINVRAVSGPQLLIEVTGDESWTGRFQFPASSPAVSEGSFVDVRRFPFHDPAVGGLSWTGEAPVGCNELIGSFFVDSPQLSGGSVSAVNVDFEQFCDGNINGIRGSIRWRANDPTRPPGPTTPVPGNLWQPDPTQLPATGDVVHLVSELNDPVGRGDTIQFTGADVGATWRLGRIEVQATGTATWIGFFAPMLGLNRLESGLYPNPNGNPARGQLHWRRDGQGCARVDGWFAVDDVQYSGEQLVALTARFEQRCVGSTGALRGYVRWSTG